MIKSQLQPEEFSQFYGTYLATLDNVELMGSLRNGKNEFLKFVDEVPDEKWQYAYEKGKWTLVEVLLHIIDTERIFQYRAFRFSRNDKTELPGFEQDDYILEANAQNRGKRNIIEEYSAVRNSTITLFEPLTEEYLMRKGRASDKPWSVGGLGFVISGHQKYHMDILLKRYL